MFSLIILLVMSKNMFLVSGGFFKFHLKTFQFSSFSYSFDFVDFVDFALLIFLSFMHCPCFCFWQADESNCEVRYGKK